MIQHSEELVLSIVVPVYNAEFYLKKNIDTLINQTASKEIYEVILVDDGSEDNSAEICEQISKEYHNVHFISQENQGVSAARNSGIKMAKGTYITFVDSDDYVAKDYVDTICNLVHMDRDLFIFNNYIAETSENTYIEKTWLKKEEFESLEYIYTLFLDFKLNAPWDKVFKRNIIDKNNIIFPVKVSMGEDLLFCLEYLKYVKTAYISECAIYYHTVNLQGLCHRKVKVEQLSEMNEVYLGMKQFSKHIGNQYKQNVNTVILRNTTNFIGKLYKDKVSSKEITEAVNRYTWYQEILQSNFKTKIDKIRKLLLKNKWYGIISIVFHK